MKGNHCQEDLNFIQTPLLSQLKSRNTKGITLKFMEKYSTKIKKNTKDRLRGRI